MLTGRYDRMTVRGVFYQLASQAIVEKTEGGYRQVQKEAAKFDGQAVELDAIPPDKLTALVEAAIVRHVDAHGWRVEQAVEAEEREGLLRLIGGAS